MEKFVLTDAGRKKIQAYIDEMKEKRNRLLKEGLDTADETELPDEETIFRDGLDFGLDEDGEIYNSWGVTDNYEADRPIVLKYGTHFIDDIIDVYDGVNFFEVKENNVYAVGFPMKDGEKYFWIEQSMDPVPLNIAKNMINSGDDRGSLWSSYVCMNTTETEVEMTENELREKILEVLNSMKTSEELKEV